MPYSTACRLTTGSVPGCTVQTSHTTVFGSADVLSTTGQAQNILDSVSSSSWTSRQMTGSYSVMISSLASVIANARIIPQERGGCRAGVRGSANRNPTLT